MSYIFNYFTEVLLLRYNHNHATHMYTFPYGRGVQTAARVQKLCGQRRVADFE